MREPSSRADAFAERWLRNAGVPEPEVPALARRAQSRAGRYPWPMAFFYRAWMLVLEWIAPLLILGTPRRTSHLAPERFDALVEGMRCHRWGLIRGLGLLATHPLIEVSTEEAAPRARPHPLEGRVEAFRPRRHAGVSGGVPGAAVSEIDQVDVLIIGSGAGGGPLAHSLAGAGLKVGLVERGGIVQPSSAPKALERHYVSQGMLATFQHGLTLVMAGQSLGGTTSVNSGTSLRPYRPCLETWDQRWGTGFAGGALDPYLAEAERQLGVTVPPRHLLSRGALAFERGLLALGRTGAYPLPRNAPTCVGSGRCCFGCPAQAKRSTDFAHLPGALDAGARIWSGTKAGRIQETADGVVVELEGPDGRGKVRCRHLVLSAGALFTPALLQASGLGRADVLGRHLRIHPATKVVAHFPGMGQGEAGVPQGMGYHTPDLPRVVFEGIHTPRSVFGPATMAAGKRLAWWLERAPDLATFGFFVRDRGEGRVHQVRDTPVIDYRLNPDDARDMGSACLLIGEAFLAAGAERVLLPISGPNEFTSRDALLRIRPEDFTGGRVDCSGFHPLGTAGIGRAVDPDLRLFDHERISICDASVLPDSPGVNPMLTIVALSLRLADRLRHELA